MKTVQNEKKAIRPFMKGYRIERNYGKESMKSCMIQAIRMVVAQNIQNEQKVV